MSNTIQYNTIQLSKLLIVLSFPVLLLITTLSGCSDNNTLAVSPGTGIGTVCMDGFLCDSSPAGSDIKAEQVIPNSRSTVTAAPKSVRAMERQYPYLPAVS